MQQSIKDLFLVVALGKDYFKIFDSPKLIVNLLDIIYCVA